AGGDRAIGPPGESCADKTCFFGEGRAAKIRLSGEGRECHADRFGTLAGELSSPYSSPVRNRRDCAPVARHSYPCGDRRCRAAIPRTAQTRKCRTSRLAMLRCTDCSPSLLKP